jgi:hypothetical protein
MLAQSARLAVVGLAMLASGVTADAQGPKSADVYRGAVRAYVSTGSPVIAVKPLLGWSRDELGVAVKDVINSADVVMIEAAALLHLEIGNAIVGISTPSAQAYYDLGAELLTGLTPSPPGAPAPLPARREEAARIRETWLRVAASALLAVGDTTGSRQYAERALRVRRSAETLTMRGMVDELSGAVYNPDDWDLLSHKTRVNRERQRLLQSAAEFYRSALRVDANYALAQIRLGRVHFLGNKMPEGREWLERGLAGAAESSVRYFGEMFIGAMMQSSRDYAGAKAAFERALAIAPQSQNTIVALANIELLIGRPDRAQQIATRYITEVDPDESWWSFKNPTIDVVGLRWLKQRVVQ